MKRALAAVLLVGLLALAVMPIAHAETFARHPECWVEGIVTKNIVPGASIWRYEDAQGIDHHLPFQLNGNATLDVRNIVWAMPFPNETYTISGKGTEDMVEWRDGRYWYIKNVLSAQTVDIELITISYSTDIALSENTYIVIIGEESHNTDNTYDGAYVDVVLTTASGDVTLRYYIRNTDYNKSHIYLSTTEAHVVVGKDADYFCIVSQVIHDFQAAFNTQDTPTSVTQVELVCRVKNSTTITGEYAEAKFYCVAFITSSDVKINTLSINQTDPVLKLQAEQINVYGLEASEIKDAQIDFKWLETPEISTIPEANGFIYKWSYILPNVESITYSSTKLVFRTWFDGKYVDYFYVQGVNRLSDISGVSPTEEGYELVLAEGLIPGNQYDVELKVTDLPDDVWWSLTEVRGGGVWWHPYSWMDRLLAIIEAVLGFLGIPTGWITSTRKRLRVAKL